MINKQKIMVKTNNNYKSTNKMCKETHRIEFESQINHKLCVNVFPVVIVLEIKQLNL